MNQEQTGRRRSNTLAKTIIMGGITFLVTVLLIFMAALNRGHLKSPDPSVMFVDRNGRFLAHVGDPETGYGYWPLEIIPERVAAATLALEDHRFNHHPGVDPIAVLRALYQNITAGRRVSGASTIAMQVARMQSPGPRTWSRKAVEAATALVLTLRHGRDRVLKHYLRLVPYGNNGHGIAFAARQYLDKPVEDLSWAEIAFLSAIPQAPGRMNPFTDSGRQRAILRGLRILDLLHQKRVVSDGEFDLAKEQLLALEFPERNRRPKDALHAILRLEEMVSGNRFERSGTDTFRITTTLDLHLQEAVVRMAGQKLAQWRRDGAGNVAVVVARVQTREVLACIGSAGYFSPNDGAVDFTRIPRSPGSALKPFIYAHALERGHITPSTILDDLPSVSMGLRNADFQFLGPLLPRQALANSRNVPAINLVKQMGIDEAWLLFRNLGLHQGSLPAAHYGFGMAVGNLPVRLDQLMAAYGTLADDGGFQHLKWLDNQSVEPRRKIFSQNTTRQITLFLSDPMARLPSFPRMGSTEYPFPVAVKTGTSRGFRDAWAVAWSRQYMVGVWTGRSDNTPMRGLGGAGSAAELAQDILVYLHPGQAGGMADLSFPPPTDYVCVPLCAYTGKAATELCDPTIPEWFPSCDLPEPDDYHKELAIDIRNNLLATPWTPAEYIRRDLFINLPARYAAWVQKNRLPAPPVAYSPIGLPEGTPNLPVVAPREPYRLRGERPLTVTIHSPADGARILQNPEMPESMNTLALQVTTDPDVPQVLWYVDGKPFRLADAPFGVRWSLEKGEHTFQARVPYREEASAQVRVMVE